MQAIAFLRVSLLRQFLLVLAALGCATCAMAQGVQRLDIGDRIKVTVFGEADLSGEFEIDGGGAFSMPLIGSVSAKDLTARELEERLDRSLRGDYLVNPQISVEVLTVRPFFLIGEVNKPGSYEFRPGLTVINAVALAGGFTFRADERDIEIRRGGETGQAFEATAETRIEPGDVIRVKERFF